MKWLLVVLLLAVLDAKIRGVAPQDEAKYIPTSDNKWSCLNNPEIVLDFSQVNDNYCDCPDGSDEPGTSLCPNGKFFCENKGHISNFIPSFQVDDGVCDYTLCCDGSDENGTIKCLNKCKEFNDKYVHEKQEREKIVRNGLLKKAKLEKIVIEERNIIAEDIDNLSKELVQKQDLLQDLENNYDPEADDGDNSILSNLTPLLDKINDKFSSQSSTIDELQRNIQTLESVLEKLGDEYNPNFNDPAVKDAIKNYQDYIVNKETISTQTDDDKSLVSSLIEAVSQIEVPQQAVVLDEPAEHVGIIGSFQNLFYEFLGLDTSSNSGSTSTDKKSNKKINDLELEISSISEEIKSLNDELKSTNYGPNDILRSYKDKCLTKKYGEYEYKYCFTGAVNQQGHGNNVLIGKFSKYEDGETDDSMRLIYENGAKCWNGPIREAVIDVVCGEKDELLSVTEPEVCQYYFKVTSPIACVEVETDKEHFKDEL